jgi:Family of unknown function (DUF6163)
LGDARQADLTIFACALIGLPSRWARGRRRGLGESGRRSAIGAAEEKLMKAHDARPANSHDEEAIQLVANPQHGLRGPARWGVMLVLFMRIVGALWILQGLMQWDIILGGSQGDFDMLTAPAQIALVFFAIFNLVAAVGLWLASPWGGVLWLFAIAAQIFATVLLPGFFAGGRVVLVIDVLLVVAYFVVTWFAAQERDE